MKTHTTNKYQNNLEISVMKMYKLSLIVLAACLLSISALANEEGEDHKEANPLKLNTEQRQAAGIVIDTVGPRSINEILRVPAEVVINAYQSASVTPRMQAQVVARHVKLGDHIETGQALVTLSSIALSEAQGNLIVTDTEWQRLKSLGSKAVGERRYTEAQVARQQAVAKVMAFGMQESQITSLLSSGDAANAIGNFDLLSPMTGTVLMDDFVVGELIEPGRPLFEISDESVLWVEASVSPGVLSNIKTGSKASVSANGIDQLEGTVTQLHHRLNETTRTQGVRIEIDNSADLLHPGQFVEAEIQTGSDQLLLAIPSQSLTLIKGSTAVFKLDDDSEFHPEFVQTGASIGDWVLVDDGLVTGDVIATEGVFYLKSLLLKSSIGDSH